VKSTLLAWSEDTYSSGPLTGGPVAVVTEVSVPMLGHRKGSR